MALGSCQWPMPVCQEGNGGRALENFHAKVVLEHEEACSPKLREGWRREAAVDNDADGCQAVGEPWCYHC